MSENNYLYTMDCQKCGASINLDLDNLISFCPYCGSKLMVDPVAFRDVLVEKEMTKRESMKYAQQDKEREDRNKLRKLKITASAILGIIGVVMLVVGNFAGSASGDSNSPWYMIAMIGFFPLMAVAFVWLIGDNDKK